MILCVLRQKCLFEWSKFIFHPIKILCHLQAQEPSMRKLSNLSLIYVIASNITKVFKSNTGIYITTSSSSQYFQRNHKHWLHFVFDIFQV